MSLVPLPIHHTFTAGVFWLVPPCLCNTRTPPNTVMHNM